MTTPTVPWDKVIDRLKVGWVKDDFTKGERVCLWQAVTLVTHTKRNSARNVAFLEPLVKVIKEQWPDRVAGSESVDIVMEFNDDESTTFADVIAACEKARAG